MLILFLVKALLRQPEVYLGCFILGKVMTQQQVCYLLIYAEESQRMHRERLQHATYEHFPP